MQFFKRLLFSIIFFALLVTTSRLAAALSESEGEDNETFVLSPFTEEQRLRGFYYHKKFAVDFDRYRLSDVGAVKRDRKAWASMMAQTLPEYKKEHARQAAPLDETSIQYREDLKDKEQFDFELEKSRKRYIQARDQARSKVKQKIKLSEGEEYGLNIEVARVDFAKRALYTGKIKKGSVSSGGNSSDSGMRSGGGGNETSTPSPPPSIPSPTEFYEPDIPPPPPPMPFEGGGFEEGIPPPIFEEPEF